MKLLMINVLLDQYGYQIPHLFIKLKKSKFSKSLRNEDLIFKGIMKGNNLDTYTIFDKNNSI